MEGKTVATIGWGVLGRSFFTAVVPLLTFTGALVGRLEFVSQLHIVFCGSMQGASRFPKHPACGSWPLQADASANRVSGSFSPLVLRGPQEVAKALFFHQRDGRRSANPLDFIPSARP